MDLGPFALSSQLRNLSVVGVDRRQLVNNPGSRSISGRNEGGKPEYRFDSGEVMGVKIPLGELRTDEKGRLLVLGGYGRSASWEHQPATTFANNDGWYDNTSDGPVRAEVEIDGEKHEAAPAMVAVTPPNYGPGLYGVVTMYDVVYDLYVRDPRFPVKAPKRPEFWQHIYPIFNYMVGSQWVNSGIYVLFGQNSPSDLNQPDLLKRLADPSPANRKLRTAWFCWFRDPDVAVQEPVKLPPFYGDGFGDFDGIGINDLAVTHTQYLWLKQWAEGDFDSGKGPIPPKPLEAYPIEAQPHALNEANLQECLGGPFHPGIELTWPLRQAMMWAEPFRPKVLPPGEMPQEDFGPVLRPPVALGEGGPLDGSGPGSLTRWLGIPWQTDEASCLSGYDTATYLRLASFWAARVPNQVLSERSFERVQDGDLPLPQRLKHFDFRQDWYRYFGPSYEERINQYTAEWDKVGIVAPRRMENGDDGVFPPLVWVETGLDRKFVENDPTYAQVLLAEMALPNAENTSGDEENRLAAEKAATPPKKRRRTLRRDQL